MLRRKLRNPEWMVFWIPTPQGTNTAATSAFTPLKTQSITVPKLFPEKEGTGKAYGN